MQLTLDGITAGYGGVAIIHEASAVLTSGSVHGIVGANGSGKSTLVRTIVGLAERYDGEVRVGAKVVSSIPTFQLARGTVSFLPQNHVVYPWMSVQENIEAATAWLTAGERSRGCRSGEGLWHAVFPRVSLRQRADTLSVGEMRCLGVVCCLCRPAEWYLLDEPTAGVDDVRAEWVFGRCRALAANGRGVVVVEQRRELVAKYCDDQWEVRDGGLWTVEDAAK